MLPNLLGRLRRLFDLAARTDLIEESLARDAPLKVLIEASPGLRVPGAFDAFELAVRAILGQQVTVSAATTLAGRLAEAFGESIETPVRGLHRLSPAATTLASADEHEIASLGIVGKRAATIVALAQAVDSGQLDLRAGGDPRETTRRLVDLPGIGPWTAQYIAMRALGWPDAFPPGDVALRKKLGGVTNRQAEAMSRAWSPWRSYATLHLWSG
jgi:AraC family transcriptional regulator of adaptative response / DNA-3-methyladenine glycosylase II